MVKRRIMQVDEEFKNEINKLISERNLYGIDKVRESERRITKAVARFIKIPDIRNSLVKINLEDDRNRKRRLKFR